VLGWWALSRLITLAAFLGLHVAGPTAYLGSEFYRSPLGLLGAWDGVWYRRIAEHGYILIPGQQSDTAFFPLFPILLRGLHVLELPYTAAGAIVSNASLAVALVAFYELSRKVVSETIALRSVAFAAVVPMSFVYSMSYPESLLMALAALALLAAFDDRWVLAAATAAAAGLTRPEAFVVAFPIAAHAWERRSSLDRRRKGFALAAVAAAPVSVATFPAYLGWALHDAGAWQQSQAAWGRHFHLLGPVRAVTSLPAQLEAHPGMVRDVLFVVAYGILLVLAARAGISWPWIVASAAILVLPLFTGSVESEGRFGLMALPVYWSLAKLFQTKWAYRIAQVGSLVLLVVCVASLPYIWP
jgi:Dolichyl-phosphate-mannose-protein mannosyltransferase